MPGRARSRASVFLLVLVILLFVGIALGIAPRRKQTFHFPEGFLWGAATAAHQVEGGNTNNDYYEWELAGKAKDRSGAADDHYNLYPQDFDLAKSLNHNAHRLSIEWSRVVPRQGVYDRNELEHYRDVLKKARANGFKTMVTLHHFTNPLWTSRQGGWSNDDMPKWFAEFVQYVVPELGDLVDFWCTVNEPNVNVLTSYVVGMTPPGVQDISIAGRVLANFMKAHAKAYHIIHTFYPKAKVGFAHHVRLFEPARWWHPGDRLVSGFIQTFWNHQIIRAMKSGHIKFEIPFVVKYEETVPELANTIDWIGINYYTRDFIKLDLGAPQKFIIVPNEKAEQNDMGWEIYPKGMYKLTMAMASYHLPIYITENGIADSRDAKRKAFICSHLRELGNAIEDGADVRGYLHWSLMDNFEWIEGFGPRFGIVEVNYATQERTVRPSGYMLADIMKKNSLEPCE